MNTIQSEWGDYKARVLNRQALNANLEEALRKTFYAGALTTYRLTTDAMKLHPTAALEKLGEIDKEFSAELAKARAEAERRN